MKYKFENNSFSGTDIVAQAHISYKKGSEVVNKIHTLGTIQTLTYSIHMDRKPIRTIGNINARDYVMGPRTIAGTIIFAVFNKHFAYEMMNEVNESSQPSTRFLADELPPFDIVISFANEYGTKSKMALYGIKLVNEGQVMSINDIYTENTYQFVALDIEYMDSETDEVGTYNQFGDIIKGKGTKIKDNSKTSSAAVEVAKKPAQNKVILTAQQTMLPKSKGTKGTVKLELLPTQTLGKIVIKKTGDPASEKTINIKDFPSQAIFASLYPGEYNASFTNVSANAISNDIIFNVADYSSNTSYNTSPPIVISKTDTSITIESNTSGHSKVKYAEATTQGASLQYKDQTMKGFSAQIKGLKPGTNYYFCTSNNMENSVSELIQCKTYDSNIEPYIDLRFYVYSNRNRFPETVSVYYSFINEVAAFAVTKDYGITEAFTQYKEKLQNDIKLLDPLTFSNIETYKQALEKINSKIVLCQQLIPITITITNDRIYAQNNFIKMTPPKPEKIGMLNSVLLVESGAKSLEVYKSKGSAEVFEKSIPSQDFYKYNNDSNAYKFNGSQGIKYRTYAVNENGIKSPSFEFYTPSDVERQLAIENYTSDEENFSYKYNAVKNLKEDDLRSNNISEGNIERLLLQDMRFIQKPSVKTPYVVSADASGIKVNVDNKSFIGTFNSDYFVTIAPLEESVKAKTFYKIASTLAPIDINDKNSVAEVTFTPEKHGIKEGKTYAIWIENSNQEQVSQPITTTLNIEDNDAEDEVKNYMLNLKINAIKQSLTYKMGVIQEVNTCIESLRGDISLVESNVLNALVLNIISLKPQLPNLDLIIKSLYEVQIDIERFSNQYFFKEALVYNITNSSVTIPANSTEYILEVQHIDQINSYENTTEIIYVPANEEKHLSFAGTAEFVVLTATDKNIYNKSGMLFIDTSKHDAKGYKLNVEVSK